MNTLLEGLFWFDEPAWRHWATAWTAFGLTCLLALAPRYSKAPAWTARSWQFALVVVLTLLVFRWPTWFFRRDLNPDEAQIVSGALTLARFHIPWKHLDPTTHGPLCEYGLLLASWLGAPFNYVTARVMAALLQVGALLAVWCTLRPLAHESSARLAILPGLTFWCLTSWDDFLHYSSELPGIFLMAWGACFLALALTGARDGRRSLILLFLAGASLGAVPYGKLQSTPQAMLIGLAGLFLIWWTHRDRPNRYTQLTALLVGATAPTIVHGVFLTVYGLWGQFWLTYVVSAFDFLKTSAHRFVEMPGRFLHFSATSPSFTWFWWGNLGFALLYLRAPRRSVTMQTAIVLAWLSLLAAWFTVLRPGRESVHYLHLLVIPLTTLAGLILADALATATPAQQVGWRSHWKALGAFVLLGLLPQILNHAVTYHRFVRYARIHWSEPVSQAAAYLNTHALPADTVATWGWHPHLLVETQLPHGTREAHSANQIMQWPLTQFFVDRYLGDLQRWRPVWFVDSVGPGAFIFADRAQHAHESIPELRDWITGHYDFVAEFDHHRIYRLKDTARPPTPDRLEDKG